MNYNSPFLPASQLTDIPNIPIRYQFDFGLLECDEQGRKCDSDRYTGKSCLQVLIEGPLREVRLV